MKKKQEDEILVLDSDENSLDIDEVIEELGQQNEELDKQNQELLSRIAFLESQLPNNLFLGFHKLNGEYITEFYFPLEEMDELSIINEFSEMLRAINSGELRIAIVNSLQQYAQENDCMGFVNNILNSWINKEIIGDKGFNKPCVPPTKVFGKVGAL